MTEIEVVDATSEDGLRKITLFDYGLHIASPLISVMMLTIIALIINYVKRDDARGTVWESHMNWMISTCWWTLFWIIVTLLPIVLLSVVTMGLLSFLFVIPVLWYLYRMIKGLLRALDGRPMPQ